LPKRRSLSLSFSAPKAASKAPNKELKTDDDDDDVVVEDDDVGSSADDSSVSFSSDDSSDDYSDESVSEYSDDSQSLNGSSHLGSSEYGAPHGQGTDAPPNADDVAAADAADAADAGTAAASGGAGPGVAPKRSMFASLGGLGSTNSSSKGGSKGSGSRAGDGADNGAGGKAPRDGTSGSGHAGGHQAHVRFSAGGHELQFRTKPTHMSKPEQWERRSHALLSYPAPLPLTKATLLGKDGFVKEKYRPGTVDYVLELHPPLVLENLLPHRAVFELIPADGDDDAGGLLGDLGKMASTFQRDLKKLSKDLGGGASSGSSGSGGGIGGGGSKKGTKKGGGGGLAAGHRKRMLWCHELAHGDAVAVHSVGLESELKLLVNLGFCRSTGDGALIHVPSDAESARGHGSGYGSGHGHGHGSGASPNAGGSGGGGLSGLRSSVGSGVAELGEQLGASVHDGFKDIKHAMAVVGFGAGKRGVDTSVTLTDRMGQRTVLHIKNELGPAGNRKVTVFCPYWLVNLTQYSLLFKQDTKSDRQLPAGSMAHYFDQHAGDSAKAKARRSRGGSPNGGRAAAASVQGHGADAEVDAALDDKWAASAAADAAAAADAEAAANRRNGSLGQRLYQTALDRRAAARRKRVQWARGIRSGGGGGGSGGSSGGGDAPLGDATGDAGLAWRRGLQPLRRRPPRRLQRAARAPRLGSPLRPRPQRTRGAAAAACMNPSRRRRRLPLRRLQVTPPPRPALARGASGSRGATRGR
jgi:hypothetical protein